MSIRISNESISVVIRSFALADWPSNDQKPEKDKGADTPRESVVVWLDIAPNHPKALNAIWASLVNGTGEFLSIMDYDTDRRYAARGLNRRYQRLQADAPSVASSYRSRPKHLRLIAPEACRLEDYTEPFVVFEWPGLPCCTVLAAMLEQGSPYPIRLTWGEYLLNEAIDRGHARSLITGGAAPIGYLIDPAPWPEIIGDGIRRGAITLDDHA